mgnify:CR=1 FL=1
MVGGALLTTAFTIMVAACAIETLMRNIAFRESYQNIKTGIRATPSPPSRASKNSKKKRATPSPPKSKMKHKQKDNRRSTAENGDIPVMAASDLSYVPNINLSGNRRTITANSNNEGDSDGESGETAAVPGPLMEEFFSASSMSRSDVVIIPLICLLASHKSLQEISDVRPYLPILFYSGVVWSPTLVNYGFVCVARGAIDNQQSCKKSGEYGVMSAPAMVVNAWFGGGAQVKKQNHPI